MRHYRDRLYFSIYEKVGDQEISKDLTIEAPMPLAPPEIITFLPSNWSSIFTFRMLRRFVWMILDDQFQVQRHHQVLDISQVSFPYQRPPGFL